MNNSIVIPVRRSLKDVVKQVPLPTFYLLVLALTWPFLIVDVLGTRDILPFRLPFALQIVTGYMPTLAAVVAAALTLGKKGIRALFAKLFVARVGLQWYAFAIFGMALASLAAVQIYNLLPGVPALPLLSPAAPPHSGSLQLALIILVTFIVTGLINGEELAWRGFALPRLQARMNALQASLVLGVFWALFHLPLFFALHSSAQSNMSWVSFTLSTVSMSIIYTWMYNHTRGNVLLAYLLHAACNTWTVVFSVNDGGAPVNWVLAGLVALAAVVITVTQGPENLSRTGIRVQE